MGVWNAIECWFLPRLDLGIKSSAGILALPFRPLYSSISLLSFLLFLRDSHFNCPRMQVIFPFQNCNFPLRIWLCAFARFLFFPEELHLGAPTPNCHTPGLGAPTLYKLRKWIYKKGNKGWCQKTARSVDDIKANPWYFYRYINS